jgi:hypothetical protein
VSDVKRMCSAKLFLELNIVVLRPSCLLRVASNSAAYICICANLQPKNKNPLEKATFMRSGASSSDVKAGEEVCVKQLLCG